MGYLVYCPTCNGKMSNNASTCPHCGERSFYKSIKESVKCKCKVCNGLGYYEYYSKSVQVLLSYGSLYVEGVSAGKKLERVWDNIIYCWVDEEVPQYKDHPEKDLIKSHFKSGKCKLVRLEPWERGRVACENNTYKGSCNQTLYYDIKRATCRECNGEKYIYQTEVRRQDIRKKV